jgi:hypothetical protein
MQRTAQDVLLCSRHTCEGLRCALGYPGCWSLHVAVREWLPELVSRAFPSWNRSMLTEIYLCHACSYQEIEDGHARAGTPGRVASTHPRYAYLALATDLGSDAHHRELASAAGCPWVSAASCRRQPCRGGDSPPLIVAQHEQR